MVRSLACMKSSLELKKLYESAEFKSQFIYDGNDLGATYKDGSAVFKVWAPVADKISVNIYEKGTPKEEGDKLLATKAMTKGDKCVFECVVDDLGELHGKFYTYLIETDNESVETADPYCVACGANSMRSMVVDLSKTNPEGWESDVKPSIPLEEAVIYETHVKDFSYDKNSGVSEEKRGKYIAFTEDNTYYTAENGEKYPTCVNYLKQLGVTYVHLLPIADSGSVDEAEAYYNPGDQFNWGYDPMLYNVPEGYYSTNPFDGTVRINEMKQLVMALHKAGIGVVMDVVYNHTFHTDNPLHHTAPYYYHRIDENGDFSNASGCGNETASEHEMYRNFMVNSILYWAKEYHIDGFRFDLMGIHDTDTMNAIRTALNSLPNGEKILLYGEPWMAGPTAMAEGFIPATTANAEHLMDGIFIFSDAIRDAIKGSVFEADEPAYINSTVEGALEFVDDLKKAMVLPNRITYVSAHDNFTLYDKLLMSVESEMEETVAAVKKYGKGNPNEAFERKENIAKINKMAAGIYMTAAGIPFFQAGEEFLRTKYGEDDSYKSSAQINMLDWKRAYENKDIVEYYASLIKMRKEHAEFFHMSDNNGASVEFKAVEEPKVQFVVDKKVEVVYNPSEACVEIKA